MEPIDILRDQPHSIGPSLFKLHERVVGRIWLFRGNQFAPPVVPFPDQPRVPLKGLRGREILRAKGTPQAVHPAKRGDATIGGDASSREGGHISSGGEVCAGEEDLIVGGHG